MISFKIKKIYILFNGIILRFWLKNGTQQKILSYLKPNVIQQQISEELQQIRVALDRDFTPRFLGFNNKEREFFINNNTPTVRRLYDINEQSIVFICDG